MPYNPSTAPRCSVGDCDRPVSAKGYCLKHYKRWRKHGDPANAGHLGRTTEERFFSHVEKSDGCWEWTSSRRGKGYGRFQLEGRGVSAHRFSYELHFGSIPSGMCVCHHCDNPPCVNPRHLFLGTVGTNNRDREQKGRSVVPDNRGSRHGMAKLTEDSVRAIRRRFAEGETRKQIAESLGVSRGAVADVVARRRWEWLD